MKIIAIFLLALGFCSAAHAESYRGVAFAGGSVSDNDSGYGGVVVALPGAALGRGFAVKAAVNGGRYDYLGGVGRVEAKYYGAQLALVHQWSGAWGWANFSAGGRALQTNLSPNDPGNNRAGFRLDASLGTDGAFEVNEKWRLGWYGEGGVRDESYLVRVDATRSLNAGRWRAGAEAGFQGDPTYETYKVGAVASVMLDKDLELRLAGGGVFQDDKNTKPYVSVGFSVLF